MKKWYTILFICGGVCVAGAQPLSETFGKAEALRQVYYFEEAAAIFSTLAAQSPDSTERQRAARQLILCENGQTLLRYIERPVVTGKKTVPAARFFYYYDVELPGNWAIAPPTLAPPRHAVDTLAPVFIPDVPADALYFASQQTGNWDIYVLRRTNDNQWTAPEPLGDPINTPFDERFPYLSPDGLTLYFASNGHSGMGGYDLYKSTFNPAAQQWAPPENLGFPYSSPFDDWLFVPNAEHSEAIFASSREQKSDSLTLYRLALETNPIKQTGYSINEIQRIGQLLPAANTDVAKETPDDADDDESLALYKTLWQQQHDEQQRQATLEALRRTYGETPAHDRRLALQQTILEYEWQLASLQADIRRTMETIRDAEQQMLEKGITPPARPLRPERNETASTHPPFEARYRPAIEFPPLAILPPVVKEETVEEDYRFRIEKTSVIHDFPPTADGLIYRIQIGTFARKLSPAELKGCSPVFVRSERKKWIYYIGQFDAYDEAGKALAEIKKRGFREALPVAWLNGKTVPVTTAREYEKQHPVRTEQEVYNLILGEFANGLPDGLLQAVKSVTQRDIVKKISKGRIVYIVGPFASADEIKSIQTQLLAKGFETNIEN
jgi:hypothetical protein